MLWLEKTCCVRVHTSQYGGRECYSIGNAWYSSIFSPVFYQSRYRKIALSLSRLRESFDKISILFGRTVNAHSAKIVLNLVKLR